MDLEKPAVSHYQFRLRWRGLLGTCAGRVLHHAKHVTLQVRMQTPEAFFLFEVAEVKDVEAAWPLLLKVCSQRGVEPLEYRTTDTSIGPWLPVPGAPPAPPT